MVEKFSVIASINSNKKEVFLNPFKLFAINYISSIFKGNKVSVSLKIEADTEHFDGTQIPEITINGTELVIGKNYNITSTKLEDFYFLIHANEIIDDEFSLVFSSSKISEDKYLKLFLSKDEDKTINTFNNNGVAFTDTNASFQLIRTNPKLSGNIKLVVDSDENLYLDTFKVSENLSKFSYRKQAVSPDSNFSTDVRNVFKSLAVTDMYQVPENSQKAHTIHTDFEDQYDTTYEFGVETNDDRLYSENFRCLAPLWINKNLPDFFVIFRTDDLYDTASYSGIMDDTETFKKFLEEGTIVKCFDMRKTSSLGKYIYNHFNNIEEYPGSVLLQFKEQENNNNFTNGINSWIGIDVETGLFVKKDEMSYFLNRKINNGSQTDFNQFIVEGFERNHLLCPNIMNIEFMFNDDVDNFSMHRYFGLYVKENDFLTYDYVEQLIDSKTHRVAIKKYDSEGDEVDDEIISGNDSILDDEDYKDRLFFAISPKIQERLKESNDIKRFVRDYLKSPNYNNYQIDKGVVITPTYKNFMSLKFKKQIHPGEHFRICVPDFSFGDFETPVVFEIIASNDDRLANTTDNISPYLNVSNSTNDADDYVYYREKQNKPQGEDYENDEDVQQYYFQLKDGQTYSQFPLMNVVRYQTKYGGINKVHQSEVTDLGVVTYPYIFRLNFYTQSEYDSSETALLDEQLNRFKACFKALENAFNFEIHIEDKGDDTISILTNYNNAYFQHITSDIINNDAVTIESEKTEYHYLNEKIPINTVNTYFGELVADKVIDSLQEKDDTISYFGNDDLEIYLTNLDNKTGYYKDSTIIFAPLNFEILGWRRTSIVKFATFGTYNYEIENSDVSSVLHNTLVRTGISSFSKLEDFEITNINFVWESILESLSNLKYDDSTNEKIETFEDELDYILNLDEVKYQQKYNEWIKTSGLDKTSDTYKQILALKQEIINIQSFKDILYKYKENDFDTYIQRNDTTKNLNILQSPFHSDKYIISSPKEIIFDGEYISFYSLDTLHIALMGILPIKDFDTTIDDDIVTTYQNNQKLSIPKNTNVWVDDDSQEYNIKSGIYYTVEKGKFKNTNLTQGTSFIIFNDKVYYNNGTSDKLVSIDLNNKHLTTYGYNSLTVLSQLSSQVSVDYEIEKPETTFNDFFIGEDQSYELKYPIVTPTICRWKGVGMYYDHDSLLNMKNLSKNSYKNIHKGYIPTFSDDVFVDTDLYLSKSLKSLVENDDETTDYFSYLKETELNDSINMFLTDSQKPIYTIGYYNKYVNTLDFIIMGVKFSLSFSTNQFVKEISLQNYNRYEIYVVNNFNGEKDEIFINTIENVILIVLHNFNFHKIDNNNNIFYGVSGKMKCFDGYKWLKTDEYLNINKSEIDSNKIYIPLVNSHGINKKLTFDKVAQLISYSKSDNDYQNTYEDELWMLDSSMFNTETGRLKFITDEDNLLTFHKDDSNDEITKIINQGEKCEFEFVKNDFNNFEDWVINPSYNDSSDYVDDSSLSEVEKYNMMISDFVDSFKENNLKVYIKSYKGNEITIETIETSDDYTPFKIGYEIMDNVKYCIDFYNPNFIDLFEYNLNENADLISRLKTNFILSNTSINSINSIKNYYGIKVYDSIKNAQKSPINTFVVPSKSIIESDWNKAYYRLYNDYEFTRINGFVPGIAKKSFFGSKAMKIETEDIVFRDWSEGGISSQINVATTTYDNSKTDTVLNVSINLSQVFFNNFSKTDGYETFSKNWQTLGFDTENARNNFIKKTLVDYFNFDSKGELHIYYTNRLNYEKQSVELTEPSNFSKWSEMTNFESSFTKSNDEIILNLTLKDVTKKYYFVYTLKSNK